MKKTLIFLCVSALLLTVFLNACSNGGGNENPFEESSATVPAGTVKDVDEIIEEAEKTERLSGDADEDFLYNAGTLPFESTVPAFLQPHTLDEFPVYAGDEEQFTPASDDYLIASFEEGKTAIYEFFHDGSLLAVRGRTVDASGKAEYEILSEEAVFAMGQTVDKYNLLKTAASGAWDQYLYWFSKPYDDPLTSLDSDKWDEVLEILEATIPNHDVDEPNEADAGKNLVTRETVRELFDALMKENGKSPEDFEKSDLKIVMSGDGIAYASLIYYTVPADYVPGGKIENFLVSAPVSYDESEEAWVIADQKAFFAEWKSEYYKRVLTENAFSAFERGVFVKRFWVPFQPGDPVQYQGAVAGKVIEVYEAEDGELAVTVYFSTGTEEDAVITTLDSLVLVSGSDLIADVGAELSISLPAGEFMYETLLIPEEFLQTGSFSDVTVQDFKFSVK